MVYPSPTGTQSLRHNPFPRQSNATSNGTSHESASWSKKTARPMSVGPSSNTGDFSARSAYVQNATNASPVSSFTGSQTFASRHKSSTPLTNTFAPRFIKDALKKGAERFHTDEGGNDFSGKRYVWLEDPEHAFIRGEVIEERDNGKLLVTCQDGSQREVAAAEANKVNPAKFDKADDMAELTHLNEGSVIHNLHERYKADLIYTYSGLFLVTINPYCPLSIYTNEYVDKYRGKSRDDARPHIFAVADLAFRNLIEEGEDQSILVTGESGAGKTENTKKVIQYLAAVAPSATNTNTTPTPDLSQQILRANPILESFGNAQTIRNNNSSRFGKFIRVQFTRSGQICGAYINWYLFEKSRVVKLNPLERNYHIFYQLLLGAEPQLKEYLRLKGKGVSDFAYTRPGNVTIAGVSDEREWNSLMDAFHIIGFTPQEQGAILRIIAAVLHLGNISVSQESVRADQASLTPEAREFVWNACDLLGIPAEEFEKALLHPRVKAGREWVTKTQNSEQVRLAIDALAKSIYERGFGDLVNKINQQLEQDMMAIDETYFIGVLDIAGFEIFDNNSFEQLCINYTNEKLQQFFNHHMFVLEQEEYAKEKIDWQFIDFGRDLQPTIDLIELPNPIGIFSCLDEDSVMPKATDKSFTEKLHSLWDRKTRNYHSSRLSQGFVLTHYAAEVEYSTEGWLEKNKDPLSDNLTRILSASNDGHIARLYADCAESEENGHSKSRVKKGLFRTVAQRHKEQLSSLMSELHRTHPHFVRCLLPNHKKRPKVFNGVLVLDQLRCNGVLEGIRIARTGFPNRLPFAEFRQRYEVLCRDRPDGSLHGQKACLHIVTQLELDNAFYRIGLTKIFFRAGVLAELEDQRDTLIREVVTNFQAMARSMIARRLASKRLYRAEATRIVQDNFKYYLKLKASPWWALFSRMKPLLGETRITNEVKKRDTQIRQMEEKAKRELQDRQKLEEERRRADLEITRVQQTLESERALALDKEEIFKRLQMREIELSEKLAEAISDQESIEDKLDQLISAKKEVEEERDLRRQQLEEAAHIMRTLEVEKHELQETVSQLEERLSDVTSSHGNRDLEVEELNRQIDALKESVGIKDKRLVVLEQKLRESDKNLDMKMNLTTQELETLRYQALEAMQEKEAICQEITQLSPALEGLAEAKTQFETLQQMRADLEAELEDSRAQLKDLNKQREHDAANRDDLIQGFSEMQHRLATEQMKTSELSERVSVYKKRADDYYSRLEQAELAAHKATRAEQFAKDQTSETKQAYAQVIAERREMVNEVEELRQKIHLDEERIEDLSVDLDSALSSKRRLQSELADYRSQRAMDVEDSEVSLEQARQKYLAECSRLSNEMEAERSNMLNIRHENSRLREELESLRSNWDNEMVNSSSWDKEKSRLEMTVQDIANSRDAAVNAHSEAQSKVSSLLTQIRSLRNTVDDVMAQRDSLIKDKQSLEGRLTEANDRLIELTAAEGPSMAGASDVEHELIGLKSELVQQKDVTEAAVGKMRRAESVMAELQKEVASEREASAQLFNERSNLEKSLQEMQMRCVDLETKKYSAGSQDIRFLHKRIQELETRLEESEGKRNTEQRSVRNVDRSVKELQSQLERRDRANSQLNADFVRSQEKVERLLKFVEELQSSESDNQLQARRAERELGDEREKTARLEKELSGLKSMRMERTTALVRNATGGSSSVSEDGDHMLALTGPGDYTPRSHSSMSAAGSAPQIPDRKGSQPRRAFMR